MHMREFESDDRQSILRQSKHAIWIRRPAICHIIYRRTFIYVRTVGQLTVRQHKSQNKRRNTHMLCIYMQYTCCRTTHMDQSQLRHLNEFLLLFHFLFHRLRSICCAVGSRDDSFWPTDSDWSIQSGAEKERILFVVVSRSWLSSSCCAWTQMSVYLSLSLCMSVCACVCAQLYCDPRQRHNDNSNNNKTAAAIASSEPREKFTCQCAAGRCIVRTDFSFRVLRYLISNSTIFGWFSNLNFFFRWHVRYNSAWTNISQRYRTKQQKFDFALLHLRFSQSNLS